MPGAYSRIGGKDLHFERVTLTVRATQLAYNTAGLKRKPLFHCCSNGFGLALEDSTKRFHFTVKNNVRQRTVTLRDDPAPHVSAIRFGMSAEAMHK